MVRLYSNENFPFPVVQELRRLGHDITTVQETGLGQVKQSLMKPFWLLPVKKIVR